MFLKVKLLWSVIECSDLFILAIDEISIKNLIHHYSAFILSHVTDDISSHKCQLFGPDKLIKACENKVRIGRCWVPLEVFQVSKNE